MQKIKKRAKKRTFRHLTLEDRVRIEIKYREGLSFRDIATYIGNGRTGSSVSREIGGKPRRGLGKYQAHVSHERALEKRFGKKLGRLKNNFIRTYAKEKMRIGWSPEQVSIRLPIEYPGNAISYEAI